MKVVDIANKYGLEGLQALSDYAAENYSQYTKTKMWPGDTKVDDSVVPQLAATYKEFYLEIEKKKELLAAEEARLAEIARTMPITSGANFEGYRIVRYAGYVSGDEVATIPMGFFTGSMSNDDVNETIKRVRNVAIQELKEAAVNIDCNAVIGLDFDYITIDRSGTQGTIEVKIVLTANGTAVQIEPIE